MRIFVFFILILFALQTFAQEEFVHPRGIITREEVKIIREKIKKEPLKSWLEKIRTTTIQTESDLDTTDPYQTIFLAQKQAQLYILTGEINWAEKCFKTLNVVLTDSIYFNNPVSRGLTRATQLFGAAMCYDFCYDAWTVKQRKFVNQKLFQTLLTTNSNMGFSANNALESNWNGVRWGSALIAALVYDDFDKQYEKNPALPFIWDIQKRLKDHISQNIFPGGWNAESLSYYVYNWSFVGPALIALQNSNNNDFFKLVNFAPNAINSLWGWATATSSISHPGGRGIQPDFSDDDPHCNYMLTALALRLYPANQIPAIKWMHDYLLDLNRIDDERGALFYSICWYPESVDRQNPEESGWLSFTDTTYGVWIWRNRFKDENDIIVAFTAPVKRVGGHKGPDNLSFRIIGLGNIWVTGAGRTGEIAGQTNLFVSKPEPNEKSPGGILASDIFKSGSDGRTYFASAEGSSTGVNRHKRKIRVHFSNENSVVVNVTDNSENGKIWRLNTPEFNDVKLLDNGFILTAPNGSMMKVTAPKNQITGSISISKVRYGGSTAQHNLGIGFNDKFYEYNKAIDIPCSTNIEIKIELMDK